MKPKTLDIVRSNLTTQLAIVAKVHGADRRHAMTAEDIETICRLLAAEPLRPNDVTVRVAFYAGFGASKSASVLADRAMIEVTRDGVDLEQVTRLYVVRYTTPHHSKTMNHTRTQVFVLTASDTFGRRGGCA